MSRPAKTVIAEPAVAMPAVLELLKPVTWFPPMWALACGAVSVGLPLAPHWPQVVAGVLLAGPLVCATSQAANDWFDRDVDAINEPHRPIPSGRLPGRTGLVVAIAWTLLSLLVASTLGSQDVAVGAATLALQEALADLRRFRQPSSGG